MLKELNNLIPILQSDRRMVSLTDILRDHITKLTSGSLVDDATMGAINTDIILGSLET